MSNKHIPFLKNLIAGLILAAIVILVNLGVEYSWVHRLCDGFFVAGLLLLCVGGLKFARNAGTFDMMTFGIRSALHITFPWMKSHSPLEQREEDFVAYKERKKEKRKPARTLVLTGLLYLGVAAVLFVFYLLFAQ